MPDHLSTTFAALADPTRRAILARLALGETSVNELAQPFDISLPAISRHLKVLERAGLISRGRDAQWRPCKLNPGQLKNAADWLDEYLKKLKSQDKPKPKENQHVSSKQRNHQRTETLGRKPRHTATNRGND